MQPIRFTYYVYGSACHPQPLDPGTALYARAWISEYECRDFRWDPTLNSWCKSDYLWRLLSKGEVDLDRINAAQLPEGFPSPALD